MTVASIKASALTLITVFAIPFGPSLAQKCSAINSQCQDGICCPGAMCQGGKLGPSGWLGGTCISAGPAVDPGPIPTKFAQGMTTIGKVSYFFDVDARNNHIVYTYGPLGGEPNGWRDLGPLPAGVTPISGPAATAVLEANYIFVTVTGSDSRNYMNQGSPPNWVGWR